MTGVPSEGAERQSEAWGTGGAPRDVTVDLPARFEQLSGVPLGTGDQSVVVVANDREGDVLVAVKTVRDADPAARERLKAEGALGRRVDSPYVVDTRAYEPDGPGAPFVATTLIDGRPLDQVLSGGGALTELKAARLSIQAAAGLEALHTAGIVHRDVNARNIMVGWDGILRITGLGSAVSLLPEPDGSHVGPEPEPGAAARDVGDLAVVLTELHSGPITASEWQSGLPQNRGALRDRLIAAGAPSELSDLVGDMTGADESLRPTASEVRTRLAAVVARVQEQSLDAERQVGHESLASRVTEADLTDRVALMEPLGRGAQGAVHRAIDRNGGGWMTVKSAGDLTGLGAELLANEAAMGQLVDSPSVARPLAIDTGGGGSRTPRIATEYVEGESLAHRLRRRGRFSAAEVAEIGAGLSAGLADIHTAGVTHRDIKPENIIIDRDGRPKIIDFGIAVPSGLDGAPDLVGGSWAYMPPANARALRAGRPETGHDPASNSEFKAHDVYALAVVLSEMASGRRTELEAELDTFADILSSPFRARALSAGVPAELADLIGAAADKDPLRRPTAAEMADRLRAIAVDARRAEQEGRRIGPAMEMPQEAAAPALKFGDLLAERQARGLRMWGVPEPIPTPRMPPLRYEHMLPPVGTLRSPAPNPRLPPLDLDFAAAAISHSGLERFAARAREVLEALPPIPFLPLSDGPQHDIGFVAGPVAEHGPSPAGSGLPATGAPGAGVMQGVAGVEPASGGSGRPPADRASYGISGVLADMMAEGQQRHTGLRARRGIMQGAAGTEPASDGSGQLPVDRELLGLLAAGIRARALAERKARLPSAPVVWMAGRDRAAAYRSLPPARHAPLHSIDFEVPGVAGQLAPAMLAALAGAGLGAARRVSEQEAADIPERPTVVLTIDPQVRRGTGTERSGNGVGESGRGDGLGH